MHELCLAELDKSDFLRNPGHFVDLDRDSFDFPELLELGKEIYVSDQVGEVFDDDDVFVFINEFAALVAWGVVLGYGLLAVIHL